MRELRGNLSFLAALGGLAKAKLSYLQRTLDIDALECAFVPLSQ